MLALKKALSIRSHYRGRRALRVKGRDFVPLRNSDQRDSFLLPGNRHDSVGAG